MIEWNASDYNRHSAAQQGWACELINKLSLKGSERVLDIGCGDGKITAQIAHRLPDGRVVGIDKSDQMIDFALHSFPAHAFPNLTFTIMDASDLAFKDDFDVVFSNAALHWITDHRPILHSISRALVSGGRCLLQMGGKGNAAQIIDIISSEPINDHWGHYYADLPFPYGFYEPDEYIPWLSEAGLTPIRVELIPRDMTQNGADGLAGWIRTTWMPYTNRIPESLREDFIMEVADTYIKKHPLDDRGLVHVPMMRLEVEAAKGEPYD